MANSKYYTVDDLIESVKRRGSVPVSDSTISEDDIIRFANEEMDENLVALVLSCREEIYLTYEDIELVDGQKSYSIPYRAIGAKVRVIKPVTNDQEGLPLTPIPLEQIYDYQTQNYGSYGYSLGFYLENDTIKLVQDPSAIGAASIRVYYYLRPNSLVPLSRGAKIRSIDTESNSVVCESIPSNITNTTLLDIIQAKPNHKTYDFDLSATVNTSNKTITFDELPDGLEVGDYICTAGETVTPQLPVDIMPMLEQSAVCKVLEAIGDTEGLKNAYVRMDKLEKRLFNVIDNRVEAPGKKVVVGNNFLRRRRIW